MRPVPAAPSRGTVVRWLLVLALPVMVVLLGAGAARARTVSDAPSNCVPASSVPGQVPGSTVPDQCSPDTSQPSPPPSADVPTSSSTTAPAPPPTAVGSPPGSYHVSVTPCGSTSGPCSSDPQQLEITYPDTATTPPNLQVSWAGHSPAGAPQPKDQSVELSAQNAVGCSGPAPLAGYKKLCWSWPSGLTYQSWILNGTYQLTPCTYASDPCQVVPGQSAQSVGVAVPPAPPRRVTTAETGQSVTVGWQPSADPEPDLVGYTVRRNGQTVYTCSIDGLGPGGAVRCPQALQFTDHPGSGRWAYDVSSLRLGVDSASADVVGSQAVAPSGGPVTVQQATAATGGDGSALLSVPATVVGPSRFPSSPANADRAGAGTSSGEGGAVSTGLPGVAAPDGPVQNLHYPGSDDPVLGKPSQLALNVGPGGPRTDIVPVAVLALGIIALAVAAHFLYLRVELGAFESRLVARRRTPR